MNGKQDYYKVGSRDSVVISSSSLSYIDPTSGGSPAKFLSFFDELIEEKESRSLRLGSLIHKWAENPDEFHVSQVSKPSEMMGIIADRVLEQVELNGEEFTPQLCLDVAQAIGYQRNWKAETIRDKVHEGIKLYIEEKLEADSQHKIYITETESGTVDSCCNAIQKQPLANQLLFMNDTAFTNGVELTEQEVYWELNGTLFKCKLDKCFINHELKAVFLTELKTMSSSVYQYKNFKYYKTYRQLAFQTKAVNEYCLQNEINIADYTWYYNVIGVETFGLFQCTVWRIQQQWILRGQLEIRDLVKRIKWHIESDEWNYQREEIEGEVPYSLEMPYEEDD